MTALQIPVIDISPSNPHAPTQLLSAAKTYGFVFIENNTSGIPPAEIAHLFTLSQQFFAQPTALKNEVSIASNKAGKNHGWLSQGIEKLDPAHQQRPDVKEALNMGEPLQNRLQEPVPALLRPHADSIVAFQESCHALCQRILRHLTTALSIEPSWFASRHDTQKGPSGTVFRMLYYPRVETYDAGIDIRAGAHADYGSMTLLFQLPGQPGLEIKTPTGEWAPVPVDPSSPSPSSSANGEGKPLPILVNIGDLLEDWTSGLLKSTVHRVIFPKGETADRYSMAYFLHPLDDAVLEPVPSQLVAEHAAKSGREGTKDMTARDHLTNRLAATYDVK